MIWELPGQLGQMRAEGERGDLGELDRTPIANCRDSPGTPLLELLNPSSLGRHNAEQNCSSQRSMAPTSINFTKYVFSSSLLFDVITSFIHKEWFWLNGKTEFGGLQGECQTQFTQFREVYIKNNNKKYKFTFKKYIKSFQSKQKHY